MVALFKDMFLHGPGRWFTLSIVILVVSLGFQWLLVKFRRTRMASRIDWLTRVAMGVCVALVVLNIVTDVVLVIKTAR